jgi:predicted RNase H-like HicB family nuclease
MVALMYEVDVTREGRSWLATVRKLPGAHTHAGNLTALRENIDEVIALVEDLPEGAERPGVTLHFPDDAYELLNTAILIAAEREAAETALSEAQTAGVSIVADLAAARYSVRDIAGALRLSPGRVSQILGPATQMELGYRGMTQAATIYRLADGSIAGRVTSSVPLLLGDTAKLHGSWFTLDAVRGLGDGEYSFRARVRDRNSSSGTSS